MKKMFSFVMLALLATASLAFAEYPADYGCGLVGSTTVCYVSDAAVASVSDAVLPPLTRGDTTGGWDVPSDNRPMVKTGNYWVYDLGYKAFPGEPILWVVDLGNENYLPQRARKHVDNKHYKPNGLPGNGANFDTPVQATVPF